MKWFLIILVVAACLAGAGWYGVQKHQERNTIAEISALVGSKGDPSKRIVSVRTTAATLEQMEAPNFYLSLQAHDIDAILQQQ